MTELDADRWGRLLESVEGPTYHQVASAVADALDVSETAAYGLIGDALDDGTLVERDGPGALPYLHVSEPFEPEGDQGVPSEPATEHYRGLRYSEIVSASYGPATEWDSWMPTCSGMNGKLPFAKYHDHPALDYYDPDDPEQSHPQYSWSEPSNWAAFEDVDRQVRNDAELVGRAFIMQHEGDPYTWSNDPPADPFLFADGDKVIDPDSGEPIPEYVASVELLAGGDPTWQEISGSKNGAHALLYGQLPSGTKTKYIQLRDEPVEGYDEPPMLELYQGPKVAVLTGNRVDDAPETYADVDENGLRRLLRAGTDAHPNVLAAAAERSGSESGSTVTDSDAGADGAVDPADIEPGLAIDPDAGPDDAPDDLPKCYERALTARYADEKLPGIGNHGTNLYASLLGVAAGYDADECTEHFAMFPPDGDRGKVKIGYTKKELRRTEKKVENGYQAPSVSALRRTGLFDAGESCDDDCPIHGTAGGDGGDGYIALLPDINGPTGAKQDSFGPLSAQRTGGGLETDPADGRLNGDGAPTIADVRARTANEITSVMEQRAVAVVDGIMGGGKTYNSIGAIGGRGEAGTYLSGRKDLYDQAAAYADEHGIPAEEIYVLPVPDDCPVWQGEYGGEWRDRVKACYAAGATMSAIHAHLAEIPCCEGDRECPYEVQNQYDPDDYLLLIGHHKHGHLPQVTAGRHTVVDEDPVDGFKTHLGGDALKRGVNAFLSLHDSPALDSFDDVLRARHDPEDKREALRWYDETNQGDGFDFKPDEQNACRFVDQGFHAYAPHAVYVMLTSEPVEDIHGLYDDEAGADPAVPGRYEFEHSTLPGIGNEAVFYTTSKRLSMGETDDYFVEFQTPPDDSLSYARSVVALDGTPMVDTWSDDARRGSVIEWEYALGRPLEHRRVLSDGERAAFLRETMGHRYIQTSPYVRYYSGSKWRDPMRDGALLTAASDTYLDGEPFDVVLSSKGATKTFRELGFDSDVDGDGRQLTRHLDHRGNVRGSDRYAECQTGAIIGAAHHGDHAIARRAAHLGAQIRPEGKGADRTYGPTGDAILEQMRELDTVQTALRIGRGKDGRGALVLIDTCAIPGWIPIANAGKPTDVSPWSKGQRSVWRAVRELSEAEGVESAFRTADVLDRLNDGPTDRTVQRALNRHADRGLLRKERDPDDGRRWVWVDTGLSGINDLETATVDLPALSLHVNDGVESEGDSDKSHIEYYMQNVATSPEQLSATFGDGGTSNVGGKPLEIIEPEPNPG